MHIRLKPWVFVTLLAIATAAILFEVDRYRHRFVRSNGDMLRLLPHRDATLFFVNVETLRRAGMLKLIAGTKRTEEPEYQEFVRQAGFDYTKDIDAIAGAADGKQVFFIARGRFEWTRVRQYLIKHGGTCSKSFCSVPTSTSGRWMSLSVIQPDVIGLALSSDPGAVEALRGSGHGIDTQPVSSQPVWVEVSQTVLKNPVNLPVPLRIFAISLESADAVVLSLGPTTEGSGAVFDLRLGAQCPSAATAEAIRNQLQIQTKMLKLELARERQQANPSDLTGLMTSGTFETDHQRVIGRWPIRKELLDAIE